MHQAHQTQQQRQQQQQQQQQQLQQLPGTTSNKITITKMQLQVQLQYGQ